MSCPDFTCLIADKTRCDKHVACEGCPRFGDCSICRNQSAVVDGQVIHCEKISLPLPCRSCALRERPDFDPAISCLYCHKAANHP